MQKNPDAILILPKLAIQNANCISSPLTWGFPSIAAVLGFVHASNAHATTSTLRSLLQLRR